MRVIKRILVSLFPSIRNLARFVSFAFRGSAFHFRYVHTTIPTFLAIQKYFLRFLRCMHIAVSFPGNVPIQIHLIHKWLKFTSQIFPFTGKESTHEMRPGKSLSYSYVHILPTQMNVLQIRTRFRQSLGDMIPPRSFRTYPATS